MNPCVRSRLVSGHMKYLMFGFENPEAISAWNCGALNSFILKIQFKFRINGILDN